MTGTTTITVSVEEFIAMCLRRPVEDREAIRKSLPTAARGRHDRESKAGNGSS
jgi:hypothetical protein